jgi:hypothetical protein
MWGGEKPYLCWDFNSIPLTIQLPANQYTYCATPALYWFSSCFICADTKTKDIYCVLHRAADMHKKGTKHQMSEISQCWSGRKIVVKINKRAQLHLSELITHKVKDC